MKRRTFVTGMTALAGVSALPWRHALAADGTPKSGGTLIVAYASDMHSGRFTLNREGPPGYETFWVSNNIHNQLVTLGPDYDIVPDLATSWEVIDKGKAYIFHLHENVKFHDDTPCDAEAVKWNFDDMLKRGPASWVYVYFNQMDSVQALDKHTVQITRASRPGTGQPRPSRATPPRRRVASRIALTQSQAQRIGTPSAEVIMVARMSRATATGEPTLSTADEPAKKILIASDHCGV